MTSSIGKVPNQLPEFDGAPGRYRDYRFNILWQYAAVKPENRQFYAPALVDALTNGSSAKELFRYQDPQQYQADDGFQRYLNTLDSYCNYLPETEIVEATEAFIYNLTRTSRQGPTEFSAVFRTCLARLESVLSEALYQEAVEAHQAAVARHAEQVRAWMAETAAYDARVEAAEEDEELHEQLGPPPPRPVPPQAPVPQPWHFPAVFTGVIYLKKYGLTKEQKSSIVRNVGGSWRFEGIERVLRSSEQLAELAMQTPSSQRPAYLADGEDADWA